MYSEDLHEVNSGDQATTHSPAYVDSAQCSEKAEETLRGDVFPKRACSSASKYYPVISDVKSLAWGHTGDSYNQSEDSSFREILVISHGNRIIVHAFRNPNKNKVFESAEEGGLVRGKWVEWGPGTNEKEKLSDSSTCENSITNKICETPGSASLHSAVGDAGSSNKNVLSKYWFRTFLTKVDNVVSNGKCLARFPPKSSLPHSADVISFDVYDNTLKFFEFLSCNPLRDNAMLSDGNMDGRSGDGGILCKCSRVFNSCSHRLIGLVLNFPEDASEESSEANIRNAGKIFVVVLVVEQWGLQWVSSVDLQDQYDRPGPHPEWADYQFCENFLVCLNTSGLVCIWGTEAGVLVARFDVLEKCRLDSKVWSELDQSESAVNRDSAPAIVKSTQGVDKNNNDHGRETCTEGVVCARTFRQLMVVSHSFLLAVVDEYGVIYVICTADYVSEDFVDPDKYSDCGMLASWKAAGCQIGWLKSFSDLSSPFRSFPSDLSTEGYSNKNQTMFTKFRKRHYRTNDKDAQLNTYSDGFSNSSQKNSWKMADVECGIMSAPLRKVFLPLDRFNNQDCICFSPFGITRLVKCYNMKEQKRYKIVHTSLYVVSQVLDDSDLETYCPSTSCISTLEASFFGEVIGCSFQGCLYLVTQDGLSVILPQVSVSSTVLPADSISIRRWQTNTTSGNKNQINISLETHEFQEPGRPWQIEVLDRALLYEGPTEAERICLENGEPLLFINVFPIAYLTFPSECLIYFLYSMAYVYTAVIAFV